jgi:hypothetical protein
LTPARVKATLTLMDSAISVDRLSAEIAARAPGDDPVERLAAAVALASELRELGDELLDRYVAGARDQGRSWSEIGAALGVSKQAAQQRFVTAPAGKAGWPRDFDADARALLPAAELHARRFRHRYLGTEHLLLALTADTGLAGTTLARLGVDGARVDEQIRRIVGAGHSSETATLGLSARTKRVFEAAALEARRLGHRCAAPEHVLLALSTHDKAVGVRILRDFDVSDERLRHQLSELLAGEAPELAAKIVRRPRRRPRRAA